MYVLSVCISIENLWRVTGTSLASNLTGTSLASNLMRAVKKDDGRTPLQNQQFTTHAFSSTYRRAHFFQGEDCCVMLWRGATKEEESSVTGFNWLV